MHTLIAFYGHVTTGGLLTNLPGAIDQHVTVTQGGVLVPTDVPMLAGAYGIGTAITAAQVTSPSLRRFLNYDVRPLDASTAPSSIPPFTNKVYAPIPLDPAEAFRASAADSSGAADDLAVLVWLTDGKSEQIKGPIYTVKCSAAGTLTPFAWSNAPLVFSQELPAGTYQVVGMDATSATLIAARLVFVGGSWRPGSIALNSVNAVGLPDFRNGNMGVWGQFVHTSPPSVDFFAGAADTAETVWLDLVKIA